MLTVPEVFTYSSNIGTARMAMMVGVEGHKAFLRKMGQLDRLRTELPENADADRAAQLERAQHHHDRLRPGLNVAPLQAMMAVAALVNGGIHDQADLPQARHGRPPQPGRRASSAPEVLAKRCATSCGSTPTVGSAKKADVPGYFAGGKTGTADKIIHGHYAKDRVFTTFMSIVPADKPKYLFLVLMDEPQAGPGNLRLSTRPPGTPAR